MTDNTMERYVAFICEELSDECNIILNEPIGLDGIRPMIKKIGPRVKTKVNISVFESYTRSARLKLAFDKYEVVDIFYMSRHKSPDKLLNEIYIKIDKIVNKTFIEDGREDEIRKIYQVKHIEFNQKMKESFENIKLIQNEQKDKGS